MPSIQIHFDGGCGPTNPGNKYGSFSVLCDGWQMHHANRFPLGWGTNNEAEFEAFICALQWTLSEFTAKGWNPADYALVAFTDSTIVRNRLSGKNFLSSNFKRADAAKRMWDLANRCLEITKQFKTFEATWRGRQSNVERFGH